jgi:hypothetical protein
MLPPMELRLECKINSMARILMGTAIWLISLQSVSRDCVAEILLFLLMRRE